MMLVVKTVTVAREYKAIGGEDSEGVGEGGKGVSDFFVGFAGDSDNQS